MFVQLAPKETALAVFRLRRDRRHRITFEIVSEGACRLDVYQGLAAMREETAGEGGVPYLWSRGDSFTIVTSDDAPGGYWCVALTNEGRFEEIFALTASAAETAISASVDPPPKTAEQMRVGWDGKPVAREGLASATPSTRGSMPSTRGSMPSTRGSMPSTRGSSSSTREAPRPAARQGPDLYALMMARAQKKP